MRVESRRKRGGSVLTVCGIDRRRSVIGKGKKVPGPSKSVSVCMWSRGIRGGRCSAPSATLWNGDWRGVRFLKLLNKRLARRGEPGGGLRLRLGAGCLCDLVRAWLLRLFPLC